MKKPLPSPLYPLRFKEIFKNKVWGGDAIRKHLKKTCGPRTGECWEVADVGRTVSQVANGALKGVKLNALLKANARDILGEDVHIRHDRFPLLIKFLFAQDRLSLQVHPTDDFARTYELEGTGKMEAWYVLATTPDARIIRGVLPGTTEAEFRASLTNGKIEDCINKLRVKEGEVIFIPPGTVHSAYGGLLLLEVQQSSDHTYRFTDWGRTGLNRQPRKLSLEKGIRAMDLQSIGVSKLKPTRLSGYAYKRFLLIKCEKFTMEKIELKAARKVKEVSDPDRFHLFTVLAGSGKFLYPEPPKPAPKVKRKKKAKRKILSESYATGQTFLMPAALGEYHIQTKSATEIIVSYP